MRIEDYEPCFIIEIEGHRLSRDITGEITSFVYEDNEGEMDSLEITITDRFLQFVDDPLFQEGNEITARFGYPGSLSARKVGVIKEIDYDFPESGDPVIQIKAYDRGERLTRGQVQRIWTKPAPGIVYSEIAEAIAHEQGLVPVVARTVGRHLRVAQGTKSDAQFLRTLAGRARSTDGGAGFVFYVEGGELHFHPRALTSRPQVALEYFTDREGLLRSFKPSTRAQETRASGTEVCSVGVDPRRKQATEHRANNETVPERTVLGKKTNLAKDKLRAGESGRIIAGFDGSETLHEVPESDLGQDRAESRYKDAELRQVEATATTVGIPTIVAKANIEIRGVGTKFSGTYYCTSVRHIFGDGYSCELRLLRNGLGKGAGRKAAESKGRKNEARAPKEPRKQVRSSTGSARANKPVSVKPVPKLVRVDADTGRIIN